MSSSILVVEREDSYGGRGGGIGEEGLVVARHKILEASLSYEIRVISYKEGIFSSARRAIDVVVVEWKLKICLSATSISF